MTYGKLNKVDTVNKPNPERKSYSKYFLLSLTCFFLLGATFFLRSIRSVISSLTFFLNDQNKNFKAYGSFFSAIWAAAVIFGFPWGVFADTFCPSTCLIICAFLGSLGQLFFSLFLLKGKDSFPNILISYTGLFLYGMSLMMTRVTINRTNSQIHPKKYLATILSFNSAFGHVSSALANQISTRAVTKFGLCSYFVALFLLSFVQILLAFFISYIMKRPVALDPESENGTEELTELLKEGGLNNMPGESLTYKNITIKEKLTDLTNKNSPFDSPLLSSGNTQLEKSPYFCTNASSYRPDDALPLEIRLSKEASCEVPNENDKTFWDHTKAIAKLNPIFFILIFSGFIMEGITQTFKNSLAFICQYFFGLDLVQTGNALALTKTLVVLKPVSGFLLESYLPTVTKYVFEISGGLVTLVHTLCYLLLRQGVISFKDFLEKEKNITSSGLEKLASELNNNSSHGKTLFSLIIILRALYEILFFPFLYGTVGKIVKKSRQGVAFGLTVSAMALGSFLFPLLDNLLVNYYANPFKLLIDKEKHEGIILSKWAEIKSIVLLQIIFAIGGVVTILLGVYMRRMKKRQRSIEIVESIKGIEK